MDDEENKTPTEASRDSSSDAVDPAHPNEDVPETGASSEPEEQMGAAGAQANPPPRKPPIDIASLKAATRIDPIGGKLVEAIRGIDASARMAREIGSVRSTFDDAVLGRHRVPGVEGALAEAHKALAAAGGFGAMQDRFALANAGLRAGGGVETLLRQHREMERMFSGIGGIAGVLSRHSVMQDAVTALGGYDAIFRRHDEMNQLAMGNLASAVKIGTIGGAFTANLAIERAMRDIAGVASFAGLIGRGGLHQAQLDALVAGTQLWRDKPGGLSLSASLHLQLPDLIPERRRATAADIAGATLSQLGERFARDAARFAGIEREMLRMRPWVDVGNPGQSVAAYVDARALATIVETGPPESRAVVAAVRDELGDYRDAEAVPEVVAADPVLRSAFRLEVGFNADLSSLPPAVIATVFGAFGGGPPRRIEADPDALESAVHQRSRRLELKLRRFIERKMMAVAGFKWTKQRVPGETVRRWRERRQIDIDNGRRPSRLFDYAGFEDYRTIIEQSTNWEEVFREVFKVKTSILETLRRLSLVRNPDAHYRIVTIEDFLDLHTEGRRIDRWLDEAG